MKMKAERWRDTKRRKVDKQALNELQLDLEASEPAVFWLLCLVLAGVWLCSRRWVGHWEIGLWCCGCLCGTEDVNR